MILLESPRISAFDPHHVSFGRHETFPLRYGWLTKGFRALSRDPGIFESNSATVELGVGKNMVHAIKYWLRATRMAEVTGEGLVATRLGEALLGSRGWDPYLEDEGTIWLVHWLLATHPELATAWFWFFNKFHKPEFTNQDTARALVDFAKENIAARWTASTVKQDAAVLLRMYVESRGSTRVPLEEALDSPLAGLHLVTYTSVGRNYQSRPSARETLPVGIVAYVLSELFEHAHTTTLAVEELMYGKPGMPAPGSVFRLTEAALLAKVERAVSLFPGYLDVRETAGIHQVYRLKPLDPIETLRGYYATSAEGMAA